MHNLPCPPSQLPLPTLPCYSSNPPSRSCPRTLVLPLLSTLTSMELPSSFACCIRGRVTSSETSTQSSPLEISPLTCFPCILYCEFPEGRIRSTVVSPGLGHTADIQGTSEWTNACLGQGWRGSDREESECLLSARPHSRRGTQQRPRQCAAALWG